MVGWGGQLTSFLLRLNRRHCQCVTDKLDAACSSRVTSVSPPVTPTLPRAAAPPFPELIRICDRFGFWDPMELNLKRENVWQ